MLRTLSCLLFVISGALVGHEHTYKASNIPPSVISDSCLQKIKEINKIDANLVLYLRGLFHAYSKKTDTSFTPSSYLKSLVNDPALPVDLAIKSTHISATFCLASILSPLNCQIIDSFFKSTLNETKNYSLTCTLTRRRIVRRFLRPQLKSFKQALVLYDVKKSAQVYGFKNQA
jgi:hypothetical protein